MTPFLLKQNSRFFRIRLLSLALVLAFGGCAGELQTRMSHDFAKISPGMTVAILPVETTGEDQEEAAKLFRQSLYANMEQTKFRVMERYLVDALLEQNGIADPEQFKKVSPIDLGEILGADAALESTMTKMDRTYAVVHSSIELGVSVKMTDTRSGEVLWMADQTENDYDGIAKIPTGITAAAFAPLQFITNKVNLHHLTQMMTGKLTASLKDPASAPEEETFKTPIIATSAAREIEEVAAHPSYQPEVAATGIIEETLQPAPAPVETARQVSAPVKQLSLTQQKQIRAETGNLFTVQVGAYKSKTHAEEMISALSAKGYKAYLCPSGKSESTLFKVHVEKFKTREEAVRYGRDLARKERLDQFVTRFPG